MNKTEELIKNLELELLTDEVRKSKKTLNELLSDDFFEYKQSGTKTNKFDVINELPNSLEEEFNVRDFNIKNIALDTYLLNYIADRKIISTGELKCTLCSSIWQKRNTIWQMIFFQGTPSKR